MTSVTAPADPPKARGWRIARRGARRVAHGRELAFTTRGGGGAVAANSPATRPRVEGNAMAPASRGSWGTPSHLPLCFTPNRAIRGGDPRDACPSGLLVPGGLRRSRPLPPKLPPREKATPEATYLEQLPEIGTALHPEDPLVVGSEEQDRNLHPFLCGQRLQVHIHLRPAHAQGGDTARTSACPPFVHSRRRERLVQ